MRTVLLVASCLATCSLVAACAQSSAARAGFDAPDASARSTPDSGGGSVPGFAPGEVDAAVSLPNECSEASKLVYVLSDASDLFSFAPDAKVFTKIGHLTCPGGRPNSMAVDRSGTAWVNYADGRLFKVSTTDATCEATPFVPGQGGFVAFGMAFATNGATTNEETLYVSGVGESAGSPSQGLATIDLKTFVLKPIGNFSGALSGKSSDLTGTGDGRLYGFFATDPFGTLAAIDTATGATSSNKTLDGVNTGSAWAFSFWGGDFWFYTSPSFSSSVTRLRTSGDGTLAVVVPDVGNMRIVGAGVSTCAPIAPPR